MMFSAIFAGDVPAEVPVGCPDGSLTNSATCSYSNYVLPGFPTRETWRRDDDTPVVFYGRAIHYAPGLMWSTALARGFDQEYLVQFDCLASGYFIDDVGRVAWLLYGDKEYRCLIVDNARPRDLYNTVILAREAIEVEFRFARDVLGDVKSHDGHSVVVVAYQIDRPSAATWLSAQRLDSCLLDSWVTSYEKEPRGWVQVRPDQQTWYKIEGWGELWHRIPGCLYCLDDERLVVEPEQVDYYTVVAGDSLDLISKKVYSYSHPRFWKAIYEANKGVMPNPYFVQVGMILRIPLYNEVPN